MGNKAIVADRLRYFRALEAAAKNGNSFRDGKTLEEAREDGHRYFYGWYNGLKKAGWRVIFIKRPSHVVPETLALINARLYIFLLRQTRRKPFFIIKLIDDALFNAHIFFLILVHKPRFVMFQYDDVKSFVCRLTGVKAVSYFGVIPSLVKERARKRILRHDHIFSGYGLSRIWPEVGNKFYRIMLGPSENSRYVRQHKCEKDIDVCIIGGFGGGIFDRRAEIVDELVSRTHGSGLNIRIFGYKAAREIGPFPAVEKKLEGIVYGEAFYKLMKRAKIMLTIPSDKHIAIEEARPQGIMEAAASGTFQLVYDTKGARDVFEEGREIALFKVVDELIEKIGYYLSCPQEREAMAANSYRRFIEEYTGESQIEKMVKSMGLDR